MKNIFKHLLLALTMLTAGTVAFAQVTTSSIGGRITAQDGGVVGAAVVAVHQPTGSQYYALTDQNGNYRINGVTPGGPYTINVEICGMV